MLSLLMIIIVLIAFFKITGVLTHIAGKILGVALGIIVWLFLGGIIITVLELTISVLPIFLVIGGAAVMRALMKR